MEQVGKIFAFHTTLRLARTLVGAALLTMIPKLGVELTPTQIREAANHLLMLPLTHRFERVELGDPSALMGLIVLGGGEERLREAGRLARRWRHLKIFVTGAGEPEFVRRSLGSGIE